MRRLVWTLITLLIFGAAPTRAESWHYAENEGLWQVFYDKDSIHNTGNGVFWVDVFALSFRASVESRKARILVGCAGPSHTLLSWQMIDASGKPTRSGTGRELATLDEIGLFPFAKHRERTLFSSLHPYVCPPVLSYMVKPLRGGSLPSPALRETMAREALDKSLAELRPQLEEAVREKNAHLSYVAKIDGKENMLSARITAASVSDCMSRFTLENGRVIAVRHTGPYGVIQSDWKKFRLMGFANRDANLMIPADAGYFYDQLSKSYELYDQLCV